MKCINLGLIVLLFSCTGGDKKVVDETETEPLVEVKSMIGQSIGEIITIDSELDYMMDSSTSIEVIAEGFNWSEGPLWIENGGYLLFSDVPENVIYKWKEGEGLSTYLTPSGYTNVEYREGEEGSNGLLLDQDGKLILCQHGDRRMARMEAPLNNPVPEFETLVDTYEGKKFNSPNDAAYHESGKLFFTDPPYGLEGGMKDERKELDFQGVFSLDSDGNVELVTKDLSRPNGIAFLDRFNMYVANSDRTRPIIAEYKIDAKGKAQYIGEFFNFSEFIDKGLKGSPDGMKTGKGGYVFATGPGGLHVFTPKGRHLGYVAVDVPVSNVALDAKEEYMYLTADMYLLRVKFKN